MLSIWATHLLALLSTRTSRAKNGKKLFRVLVLIVARDNWPTVFRKMALRMVYFKILTTHLLYFARFDFFLVSQSVRQGTVSPTHYNVIEDSSGLTPDHFQRLTYKLTHLYYNWPVSQCFVQSTCFFFFWGGGGGGGGKLRVQRVMRKRIVILLCNEVYCRQKI